MKNPNLIRMFNDVIHYWNEEQKKYISDILWINNSNEELLKIKNQALKIILWENEWRIMYYTDTQHNNEEKLFSVYIEKWDKTWFFKFHTKDYSILDWVEYRWSEWASTSRNNERKREIKYLDFIQDFKKEFMNKYKICHTYHEYSWWVDHLGIRVYLDLWKGRIKEINKGVIPDEILQKKFKEFHSLPDVWRYSEEEDYNYNIKELRFEF